jgi:hypothetical protein
MPPPLLPTPLPKPPRTLRLRPRKATGLWFGRLLPVLLILGGIIAGLTMLRRPMVMVYGSRVDATVTGLTDHKRGKGGRSYYVHYTYQAGGRQFEDRDRVPHDVYTRTTVGQHLPGRTLSLMGSQNSALEAGSSDALGMMFFALVWFALTAAAVYAGIIQPRQIRHVLQTGSTTTGVITDKRTRKHKQSRSYYLEFGYEPPNHSPITRTQKVSRAVYDEVPVGQPVTVVYDPAKPKRAVAYEYGDYDVDTGGRIT